MNAEFNFLMNAVSEILTGKNKITKAENINWQWIYDLTRKHNITNIIAYSVCGGFFDVSSEIKSMFADTLYEHIIIDESQKKCLSAIYKMFEERNIAYMPIKGAELKNIYPSTDMRSMGDADILVKPSQRDDIFKAMSELGYKFVLESNHEYLFSKPPFMHIELHKFLIPTYNDDLHLYYGDGWSFAKQQGNSSRYALSPEDHYVYLMAHLAKHYRDAGAGIRMFIDVFVYLAKYNNLDFAYIDAQLKVLNLHVFEANVKKLINVWFEGGEENDVTRAMTEFIIDGGVFGSHENSVLAKAIRDNKEKSFSETEKCKYTKVLFPKLDVMKKRFGILEKAPVLLPVFWIVRLIDGLLFKNKGIKNTKRDVELIKAKHMEKYAEHMRLVGLDIFNGRRK